MRWTRIKRGNVEKSEMKMLQGYKQKDKIKTVSQLVWVLSYLLTVRVTVAGGSKDMRE